MQLLCIYSKKIMQKNRPKSDFGIFIEYKLIENAL
jgi:hypothetical protein